jgi:hypothetical protein
MPKNNKKAHAQGFARGLKGKNDAAGMIQGWSDDKDASLARNEGFAQGNRQRESDQIKKARAKK